MDTLNKRQRSEIMAKIRSRGNASTELKIRKIFRESGIKGWRRQFPILGRPDFAFPKNRLALFIDGCFWHGCPRCYRPPKSSQAYWRQKVVRNKKRDLKVSRQLRKNGWAVLRIRECQLKSAKYLFRLIERLGHLSG